MSAAKKKPAKAKSAPKTLGASPAASTAPKVTSGGLDRERFFAEYGEAIDRGSAAVFGGAGLSVPAGFVNWKQLLSGFAQDLGLDLDIEDDLVAVAQYHINANNQDRSRLNQLLVKEFSKTAAPSAAQRTIARLPIRTYWTTNYESLLEKALELAGRKAEVKERVAHLTTSVPTAEATVFKMHGSLNDPNEMVITREDYGRYARDHAALLAVLQSDLLSKSFLFLGFSFSDPNLEFILSQLRTWVGASPRTHYTIVRRETDAYKANKQRLRMDDLKRYGIQTVLVDDFADIPALLEELERRYYRRHVVVSGAWVDPAPFGESNLEALCRELGKRLANDDYNLVTGFGLGVGSPLIMGAAEALYLRPEPHLERRLRLRPFPQVAPTGMTQEQFRTKFREDMLRGAGFIVFVAGNRSGPKGKAEISSGVLEEFKLARSTQLYPIPLGATGGAAEAIWKMVDKDFATFFPKGTPLDAFKRLNKKSATPSELLDAVFELLHHLTPKVKS